MKLAALLGKAPCIPVAEDIIIFHVWSISLLVAVESSSDRSQWGWSKTQDASIASDRQHHTTQRRCWTLYETEASLGLQAWAQWGHKSQMGKQVRAGISRGDVFRSTIYISCAHCSPPSACPLAPIGKTQGFRLTEILPELPQETWIHGDYVLDWYSISSSFLFDRSLQYYLLT